MIGAVTLGFYRLFALLSAGGIVTLGGLLVTVSVVKHRRDRYVESVIEELRPEIARRANRDDPNWDSWVTAHSFTDRDVLRAEIRRQLETVSGTYRRNIADLGTLLGIDDRARRQLSSDSERDRHRGLTTLLLLGCDQGTDRAVPAPQTHYERAMIANLCLSDDDQSRAVELLVNPGTALPGYALYTLYGAVRQDPEVILDETPYWKSWDTTLVVQVLSILSHVQWADTPAVASWLRVCLTADSPAIRTAAVNALGPYITACGDVPRGFDVENVLLDPSIRVRAAAFRQFSKVADSSVRESIRAIVDREPTQIGKHVAAVEFERNRSNRATGAARWSINWRTPWRLEWEHQPLLAPGGNDSEITESRA